MIDILKLEVDVPWSSNGNWFRVLRFVRTRIEILAESRDIEIGFPI
jgi:hypothetical protein